MLEARVGIELFGTLTPRKLLIRRNGKDEKKCKNAELRYTVGTRNLPRNDFGAAPSQPTLRPATRR
jgi:hypothetical protein